MRLPPDDDGDDLLRHHRDIVGEVDDNPAVVIAKKDLALVVKAAGADRNLKRAGGRHRKAPELAAGLDTVIDDVIQRGTGELADVIQVGVGYLLIWVNEYTALHGYLSRYSIMRPSNSVLSRAKPIAALQG
jgi:hypothetical protein